ncbi:HD domain-containing protein [archaeon]|nr:MAG: HD domain-containing protein [archaeon]
MDSEAPSGGHECLHITKPPEFKPCLAGLTTDKKANRCYHRTSVMRPLSCRPIRGFDLWLLVYIGIWGSIITVLAVVLPVSLRWPEILLTVEGILITFLIVFVSYERMKQTSTKKDQTFLDSILDSIKRHREELDKNAQRCSRETILAAFPPECRTYVEYVLDHERVEGELTNEYKEIKSLRSATNQLMEKDRALSFLKNERDRIAGEFAEISNNPVGAFLRAVSEARKNTEVFPATARGRVIRDRVFHELYLEPALDALLSHPIVDRLRSVKQLSFTYQEQPTALHSRLTHSLGVAKNVEFALLRIFEQGKQYVIEKESKDRSEGTGRVESLKIDADTRRKLVMLGKAAGLLHDIGHAPFGHALDRFVAAELSKQGTRIAGKTDKHFSAQYVRELLAPTLNANGLRADALAYVIRPTPETGPPRALNSEPYAKFLDLLAAIIDSDLDADRIDFLARDSDSTGLPYGAINAPELLSSMLPIRYRTKSGRMTYGIAYDENAVGFIEHAVSGRIKMYESCYESEPKIASETMLTNAVRYFLQTHKSASLQELLLLTDDELLALVLATSSTASAEHKLLSLLLKQRYFRRVETIYLRKERRSYESMECERYLNTMNAKDSVRQQFRIVLEWQDRLCEDLLEDQKWMIEVYATPYDRFALKEQGIRLISERGKVFDYYSLAKSEKAKAMVDVLADRVKNYPRIEIFAHDAVKSSQVNPRKVL